MEAYEIGIIVLVMLCLGLLALFSAVEAQNKPSKEERYLESLYMQIWTGKDEDRVYAWFRVMQHLKTWNYDQKLITRAAVMMENEKRNRSEEFEVNRNGRLVKVTVIS